MQVKDCEFEVGDIVYYINATLYTKKCPPGHYIPCRIFGIHITAAHKRSHILLENSAWPPSLRQSVPFHKVKDCLFKTKEEAENRLKELNENAN